jgi:hypothetical protein
VRGENRTPTAARWGASSLRDIEQERRILEQLVGGLVVFGRIVEMPKVVGDVGAPIPLCDGELAVIDMGRRRAHNSGLWQVAHNNVAMCPSYSGSPGLNRNSTSSRPQHNEGSRAGSGRSPHGIFSQLPRLHLPVHVAFLGHRDCAPEPAPRLHVLAETRQTTSTSCGYLPRPS